MTELVIRELTSPSDFRLLEQAQSAIWGRDDAIPYHQTMVATQYGGVALGAFDGGKMVGFAYGFPAYKDGRAWLHSHILGVLPEYRRSGLGSRLKWAQRRIALDLGYDLMTWTYDPLRAANAYLNIRVLGGVVRRYLPNYYGIMSDKQNEGLPSDRLLLEWHLRSERVHSRDPEAHGRTSRRSSYGDAAADRLPEDLVVALEAIPAAGLFPAPGPTTEADSARRVAVAVPWALEELKTADPALAATWHQAVGHSLQHHLERGYVAVDVIAPPDARRPGGAAYYVLERGV